MHPTPPYLHALVAMATTLLIVTGCKERTYPSYRENPNPKAAIPIRIKVTDAPVDVPLPKVLVEYQIDLSCLPPIRNFAGVHPEPKTHWVEYPVQRVSDTDFASRVFEDGMEIADYYRHGPCSWTMQIIQAAFPFVVENRTIQASGLSSKRELTSGDYSTTTYSKKALTTLTLDQSPATTSPWASSTYTKLPEAEQQKFFSIEVSQDTHRESR